jgi:hypothetical protein
LSASVSGLHFHRLLVLTTHLHVRAKNAPIHLRCCIDHLTPLGGCTYYVALNTFIRPADAPIEPS